MNSEFGDPFAKALKPSDDIDTTRLSLVPLDDPARTEDGGLSLVSKDQPPVNEVGTEKGIKPPEVWLPGIYETALTGGKSIEGIPSSASVSIDMGKTDDKYMERTKNIWLSYKEGKNFIQETVVSHSPAPHTNITYGGNKIEIHEGETVIMGREFNDERDPSEHFDITDKHDKRVSRKHVSISLINGTYSIKDLDSTNGSFVKITIERPKRPPEPPEEPLPRMVI